MCGIFFMLLTALRKIEGAHADSSFAVQCSTAAASALAGVVLTNPLDVVRTRFQVAGAAGANAPRSVARVALELWRNEPRRLVLAMRGVMARAAALVPDLTIGVVVFETVYAALSPGAADSPTAAYHGHYSGH
jgi:hypothetical protein